MAPPAVLTKIKLLLKLTESPEPNEAAAAQALANKLIEKHGLTQEEVDNLKDPKPLYGEEDRLFLTFSIVGWMCQLALGVATYFDCLIVQEQQVPTEGATQYHYYVYGDPQDVFKVKLAWNAFHDKVREYMTTRCVGESQAYLDSYGEGMVESIRENIHLEGITLPNKTKLTPTQPVQAKPDDMVSTKKEKVRPAQETVDVNAQSMVKDITGYFVGFYDGRNLSLVDILQLAMDNQEPEQLE